jgi:tetratricopeptide (TPR) repeat protein
LRLSPLDPWRSSALVGLAFAHFHRARYEDAIAAARKATQISPGFSIPHMLFAASLAKIGRTDEAKAAAARGLELQPEFHYSRFLAGAGCTPPLAASLSDALHSAGLPR